MIKAIPDAEGPPQLEEMGRALMRDVIGEQSFSLGDADFAKLANREDLLSLAVGFTMDKQKFYRLLQSFAADEDALNTIETIIAEESDHIDYLDSYFPHISGNLILKKNIHAHRLSAELTVGIFPHQAGKDMSTMCSERCRCRQMPFIWPVNT